jgi:hypothetical protein
LAEIERAAKEAVAVDRLEQTSFFNQRATGGPPPPPPPPPQPPRLQTQPDNGSSSHYGENKKQREERFPTDEEERETQLAEENESGVYKVDGETYLQGQKHEHLLRRGINCEIFVETADEWFPALVMSCKEVAVPHTNITLKSYEVSYIRDEEQEEEKQEDGDEKEEEGAEKGVEVEEEKEDGDEVKEEEKGQTEVEGIEITDTDQLIVKECSSDVNPSDDKALDSNEDVVASLKTIVDDSENGKG